MNEIIVNTAFSLSKKYLISNGVIDSLNISMHSLMGHAKDKFIDLVLSDLKDSHNNFQVILTIKKLDDCEEDELEELDK